MASLASSTLLPAAMTAAAANAANRIAQFGTASFSFDSKGQTISGVDSQGTTTYDWDGRGRMVHTTLPNGQAVSYGYDALGRRVSRSANGITTSFVYDGLNIVLDRNSNGTMIDYLNGDDLDDKLRQASVGAASLYFLQDHLGSTSALTATDGSIVEQLQYQAFGDSTGSALTRYGYTGRERDNATGLIYYRARWYKPGQGRFISEDPIGINGGINLYSYVRNDPLSGTDPSGLWVEASFDRRTGTLTARDAQTGQTVTIRGVFSGVDECRNNPRCDANKNKGPVPRGRYLIGTSYPNPNLPGAREYPLYGQREDGKWSHGEDIPVKDPTTGATVKRGAFFLHAGLISLGCVTVPSEVPRSSPNYPYDLRGQVELITDGLGGQIRFGYDNRRNLVRLADQRGNTTTYSYDELYRPIARRDPVGRTSEIAYDPTDNVVQTIDRLGRRTALSYDALDRLTRATYVDATVDYVYDAASRLVRIEDTEGGTLSWTHDSANRVTSETTPAGVVSYSYNSANQRISMNAADRPLVSYGYDLAGRLQTITQGAEAFTYGYDTLSRRATLQRPNGVTTTYGHDQMNRLARLLHAKSDGTPIEDYHFSYNLDDEITSFTSLASAHLLPTAKTATAATVLIGSHSSEGRATFSTTKGRRHQRRVLKERRIISGTRGVG